MDIIRISLANEGMMTMVAVIDKKLVFGRGQVLTSTQASKNFGEARRRARKEPQFVSDRNDGIDTVIVGFDEFEAMAVELEELREERLYALATARLAQCDADPNQKSVPVEDVMGRERYEALLAAEAADPTPDSELFE